MTRRDILERLVSSTRGGLAALLVDEGGETVDWVSTSIGEEELRLSGAYVGLRMRGARAALTASGPERLERLRLERQGLVVSAQRLDNDWCIVLVQDRPAYPTSVRSQLEAASAACDRLLHPEVESA